MPFVQGKLRHESLAVTLGTECAHCARPMRITVDSELKYVVGEGAETNGAAPHGAETHGAAPLVFVPIVNFAKLKAPNIIDDF